MRTWAKSMRQIQLMPFTKILQVFLFFVKKLFSLILLPPYTKGTLALKNHNTISTFIEDFYSLLASSGDQGSSA